MGLAVHSSAINRAAMVRDIFGSPLGLGDLLFLERVSPLRVVLYRSYGASYLGGMWFCTMAPRLGASNIINKHITPIGEVMAA